MSIGTDHIDASVSVASSEVSQLGVFPSLTESDLQALLDLENFGANQAATFNINNQTYLAINDDEAGFSADSDAIIEITGFSGNLADLAIT